MGPAAGLPGGSAGRILAQPAHRLLLSVTLARLSPPAVDRRPAISLPATIAHAQLPTEVAPPVITPAVEPSEPVAGGADDADPVIGFSLPRYYAPEELTQRPQVLRDVPPILQREWQTREPKKAVLLLLINETGMVDKIEVEESALPAEFERLTLQTFAAARFTAGEIDGVPVKSRIRIEVKLEQAPLLIPNWGD